MIQHNTLACLTMGAWLAAASLFSAPAVATDRANDAFLAGYLSSVLERELGWARDSYQLEVRARLATITLPREDEKRRAQLASDLPQIDGLEGVNIIVADNSALSKKSKPAVRKKLYSFLGLSPDTIPFPTGDLFLPLLADPKQPQFFVSVRRYDTPGLTVNTAAVGYGETFGLYRRAGQRPEDGLQVSISGALFAQFNLDAPSDDLVNADYVIGVPVTYRHGPWSVRARVYHQSSHLGDEFLLRAKPERINLSFESLELLVSYERKQLRGYFGGEYLLAREPSDLKRASAHGGVEFRGKRPLLFGGRLVGGLDLKSWQEHNWSVDGSLKVGLEFGAAKPGRRRLRVMAEAYDGYAPHGQFYDDKISYLGTGIYLGF